MKFILQTALLITLACNANGQSFNDSIRTHRQHYKAEFISEARSPLKGNDTAYLRFYAPNKKYRIAAVLTLTPNSKEFDMPTYSGKTKKFRQYGTLNFKVKNQDCSLQVYQNISLLNDPKYADHLFIPFTDKTSNRETYGGGRYIDVTPSDIHDNVIVLDFNKCYNPYCAYASGYNCPIPPAENRLPVAIKAGEKIGQKKQHTNFCKLITIF